MFKIIGGVVVGGLALLGVAKLLEQEKRIVVRCCLRLRMQPQWWCPMCPKRLKTPA